MYVHVCQKCVNFYEHIKEDKFFSFFENNPLFRESLLKRLLSRNPSIIESTIISGDSEVIKSKSVNHCITDHLIM